MFFPDGVERLLIGEVRESIQKEGGGFPELGEGSEVFVK